MVPWVLIITMPYTTVAANSGHVKYFVMKRYAKGNMHSEMNQLMNGIQFFFV